MTDQTGGTPAGGAPGGAPGGEPGNSGGNFMRSRVEQMSRSMTQPAPAPAPQPGAPEHADDRTRGHSPAMDARREQTPPARGERMVKIGESEFSEQAIGDMIARDAEARIRRSELPSSPEAYEARNTPDFKLPEGVSFQFNQSDPALLAAKKYAADNGLTQTQFSGMLDLFVSSQLNQQMAQARAREANLQQLGATGAQRIDAVSTWLKSFAGKDGAAVADFISKYPSAPIVRAMETVVRRFSNQGGADFSQSHRETNVQEPGKIAGYENMNFAQRRAAQVAERMRTDPNYARGSKTER